MTAPRPDDQSLVPSNVFVDDGGQPRLEPSYYRPAADALSPNDETDSFDSDTKMPTTLTPEMTKLWTGAVEVDRLLSYAKYLPENQQKRFTSTVVELWDAIREHLLADQQC